MKEDAGKEFDALFSAALARPAVEETCEIPLGRKGLYVAIVSAEDYPILSRYKWNYKRSRGGGIYARRSKTIGSRKDGTRTVRTILMHVAVMELTGEPRPTPEHTPDHKNRNSLDNTRTNLRWACRKAQYQNSSSGRRRAP